MTKKPFYSVAGTRIPVLPSLRALTRELRALHEAFSHPIAGSEHVTLVCECLGSVAPYYVWRVLAAGQLDSVWIAHLDEGAGCAFGHELIPGDGAPYDAVAAARRLLAAARDGGVR